MVKTYKLHKFIGLGAGIVLFILALSGFLLDHKQWDFLYSTTFTNVPDNVKKSDNRLFDSYWIDPQDSQHAILGSKRGIYETFDEGKSFHLMSHMQTQSIKEQNKQLYAATSDGVYLLESSKWKNFALKGQYITSLAITDEFIVAVVDKSDIVTIKKENAQILSRKSVNIESSQLQESITLSRFVRDLHYARGLLEGDLSILINDYGAVILGYLALSGFLIWWLIHKKKTPKLTRKLIKTHSNILSIVALIPLLILAVTGIFLDHSSALMKFMTSVKIPHSVLPPVYSTLRHDIWSIDYDGKTYRVGNRYGVYKSSDLTQWQLENKGFAYKMIRKGNVLYVSGMGAPNRKYDGQWSILKNTPPMFRDIVNKNGQIHYFSFFHPSLPLPAFNDATLYSLMLTLHDGSFFASWWIWIDDLAAIAIVLLGLTGIMRWYKKRVRTVHKT